MFGGIPIAVNALLAGAKHAVKLGGTIYVSPAMYNLISHANEKELTFLLTHLKLCDMDPKPSHDLEWEMDTMKIELAKLGLWK